MAISRNPLKLVGRYGCITLYKVGEQIRMRMRHPLDRKRVLKSPEFRNTRVYAGRMARASKIGSRVYQALPKEFRQFWMYKAFVGEAMTMLNEGTLKDKEVFERLWRTYAEVWQLKLEQEKEQSVELISEEKEDQVSWIRKSVKWHKKYQLPIHWQQETFIELKSFVPAMRAP